MSFTIEKLSALEILDSRGRPTVEAECWLAGGARASASVPSGASTGTSEARELRDGEARRFRGLGCRRAVANIINVLQPALAGSSFASQAELDRALLTLDSTPDKSHLGANAILAVSLSFARAAAQARAIPLYSWFAESFGQAPPTLPRPIINLFSGGKHAGGQAPLQDVLILPASATSFAECLQVMFEIYQCAAELIGKKYAMRLLRADEGGLAPPFPNAEAMLEDAVAAIESAGLKPGREVCLGVDVAATHFYSNGVYHLGKLKLDSLALIEQLAQWADVYPIVSIEDGLAEEDWEHWPKLRHRLQGKVLVVGDDLLCTNPARITRAINCQAADTLLLKVNQIGTLTQALEARRLAQKAQWRVMASARSGETEDQGLADLAVGWAADLIKVGSITQSERLSKYNRLLAIEAATGFPLAPSPAYQR